MNIEEIYDLVSDSKYEAVQKEIDNGIDVNITDGVRQPLAEFASFSDDFKMLEILWKAGAKATTPYLEEIFNDFENGTIREAIDENKVENIEIAHTIEPEKFRISNIPISQITLNNELQYLSIKFENFRVGEQIVNEVIKFDLSELETEEIKKGIRFKKDELTSSIYLFDVHNPIDIEYMKLKKKFLRENIIELKLLFDFEHESTGYDNEIIEIKTCPNTI